MARKINHLKMACRMAIQSHSDNELLFFTLKAAGYIKPRVNLGIVDKVFAGVA